MSHIWYFLRGTLVRGRSIKKVKTISRDNEPLLFTTEVGPIVIKKWSQDKLNILIGNYNLIYLNFFLKKTLFSTEMFHLYVLREEV